MFFRAKSNARPGARRDDSSHRTDSVLRARLQLRRARHDTRDWQVKRRERTRQLIELGGLIAKAGLVELTNDDRALIYGALIDVASRLRGEDGDRYRLIWARRGRRGFADDANAADERQAWASRFSHASLTICWSSSTRSANIRVRPSLPCSAANSAH